MTGRPLRPRALARLDVEAAIDHHLREADQDVALGLIDALQAVYRTISDHPRAGSPRYAHELGVPGLLSRQLRRYPYLVFHVERDDHIDVGPVLHAQRDIPAWMQDPES